MLASGKYLRQPGRMPRPPAARAASRESLAPGKHFRLRRAAGSPGLAASPSSPAAAIPLVRAFSRELARAGGLLSPDYLASGMSLGEARCLYDLGHSDGLEI